MPLQHYQCPAPNGYPSVFIRAVDGILQCDHCARRLIPFLDLPDVNTYTANDRQFNRIASMVVRTLHVDIALVKLVDQHGQTFAGQAGLAGYMAGSPLSASFSQFVVMSESPFVIPDAQNEPLVADQLAETALEIGAYAGFPVQDGNGAVIGSLCAINKDVHQWESMELELISDFAALVSSEIGKRNALMMIQAVARESMTWDQP